MTNIRYFYAADYADDKLEISAFTVKEARDEFVKCGNRRFAKTSVEADNLCTREFGCSARCAVGRGLI